MNNSKTFQCEYCGDWFETDNIWNTDWCPTCSKLDEYKDHKRNKVMIQTRTKLVHFTDLNGKNRYFLNIKSGNMIRQQEINSIEYHDLKSAEEKHYLESINRFKIKYDL
jgi:hypothetical protein